MKLRSYETLAQSETEVMHAGFIVQELQSAPAVNDRARPLGAVQPLLAWDRVEFGPGGREDHDVRYLDAFGCIFRKTQVLVRSRRRVVSVRWIKGHNLHAA